jgi:hypothetical protein
MRAEINAVREQELLRDLLQIPISPTLGYLGSIIAISDQIGSAVDVETSGFYSHFFLINDN